MEWRDRGTVLGGRAYGETSVIVELLTAEHGRHLGLVSHHKVALDSAGFVGASRYRGFPWLTQHYLDLVATAPWLWWAELAKVPPA